MNKLNKDLGQRPLWKSKNLLIEYDDAETLCKVGEKITFMNWGNFNILTKEIQPDGSYNMTAEFLPEDQDFKKTKKITWLADGTNLLVVNLWEFDHLIKVPKLEEEHKFEDVVNLNSKFQTKAYVDSGVRLLKESNILSMQTLSFNLREEVTSELIKSLKRAITSLLTCFMFPMAKRLDCLPSNE